MYNSRIVVVVVVVVVHLVEFGYTHTACAIFNSYNIMLLEDAATTTVTQRRDGPVQHINDDKDLLNASSSSLQTNHTYNIDLRCAASGVIYAIDCSSLQPLLSDKVRSIYTSFFLSSFIFQRGLLFNIVLYTMYILDAEYLT